MKRSLRAKGACWIVLIIYDTTFLIWSIIKVLVQKVRNELFVRCERSVKDIKDVSSNYFYEYLYEDTIDLVWRLVLKDG